MKSPLRGAGRSCTVQFKRWTKRSVLSYFRCCERYLFISNIVTLGLPKSARAFFGEDFATIFRILKLVLLDIVPDLADDLAARQRRGTDDFGKFL